MRLEQQQQSVFQSSDVGGFIIIIICSFLFHHHRFMIIYISVLSCSSSVWFSSVAELHLCCKYPDVWNRSYTEHVVAVVPFYLSLILSQFYGVERVGLAG